jgi:hypothetical protein
MNRFFALVLLAVGFATSARADYIPATWTDTVGGASIGHWDSHTYVHNLTDNGFRPSNDIIDSFHLAINLADDDNNFWNDLWEVAEVDLPGRDGDDPWIWNFGGSGNEYGGWSMLGLMELNELGTLTVTITSIFGDFNLVSSSLTAAGRANTSVPEPGALGLLGVGLMGMALSMRRRQLAKRS